MSFAPQKTILCVIGTRPEAIKMAPVIKALESSRWARCRVLLTGQHRELVDEILPFFEIKPHFDLDVMPLNLPLDRLAAHLVGAITEVFVDARPNMVLAQGIPRLSLPRPWPAHDAEVAFGHCGGRSAHRPALRSLSRRGQPRRRVSPQHDPLRSHRVRPPPTCCEKGSMSGRSL